MSTVSQNSEVGGPSVVWRDRSGRRWDVTLVPHPPSPRKEREIQLETDAGIPQRVLCVGPVEERFSDLSSDELELVRRAAEARRGILWMDPRDGQLWWVDQEHRGPSGWALVYSNAHRTQNFRPHPLVPVTFLDACDLQRLLDGAGRHVA